MKNNDYLESFLKEYEYRKARKNSYLFQFHFGII